mmetsp:Transcript_48143/g.145409  ORF Transcript_48143/g.145409 Transcript_48143/m.145409 type:complete len:165 (-) Transcript_48143:1058-1552(-)
MRIPAAVINNDKSGPIPAAMLSTSTLDAAAAAATELVSSTGDDEDFDTAGVSVDPSTGDIVFGDERVGFFVGCEVLGTGNATGDGGLDVPRLNGISVGFGVGEMGAVMVVASVGPSLTGACVVGRRLRMGTVDSVTTCSTKLTTAVFSGSGTWVGWSVGGGGSS